MGVMPKNWCAFLAARLYARLGALLLACCLWSPAALTQETLHVAVASNFNGAMKALANAFEQASGHQVLVSVGSSGKLYAQILNGAPYDLFFSADQERPQRLAEAGLTRERQALRYARGILLLWMPQGLNAASAEVALARPEVKRIAIANPKLAPYGAAAEQVLAAIGSQWQEKLVYGENIGQAFHFVATGQAQAGFVAMAQMVDWRAQGHKVDDAQLWPVPAAMHQGIDQYCVSLIKGRQPEMAAKFIRFVQSDQAKEIIGAFGYEVD